MRTNYAQLDIIAGCSVVGGFIGALGGATLKSFIGSVSIIGHSSVLGLFPLASYGIYHLLEAQKVNTIARSIFSVLGGYLAAYAVPNCLGFSVSMIGPLLGVTAAATLSLPIVGLFVGIYFCTQCSRG